MRSKTLVCSIAGLMLAITTIVSLLSMQQPEPPPLAPQIIRFVLTCFLAFSLIKRWSAARWIAVVLLGLGGIGSLMVGLSLDGKSGLFGLLALTVVYGGCAIGLLSQKAGRHFRKRY